MRYQESSERSAELLRLILPRIAHHNATYHPTAYAVWYEYLAQLNPQLKRVLDERLQQLVPLSSEETDRLFEHHISRRNTESSDQLQTELATMLSCLDDIAKAAGMDAADFSRSLSSIVTQLDETLPVRNLRDLIGALARRTLAARSSADVMHQRVEAMRQELASLKDELEIIHGEAMTDPLTGLNNRRGFERAVDAMITSRPDGLAGCVLIMADIDAFKRINDTYGHLLGDQVLRAVGQVLHSNIKGRDLVARVGGEEFALLLPDTDLPAAVIVAEQVRSAVSRGRLKRNNSNVYIEQVTISLGVAAGQPNEPIDSLMERADRALYIAKKSGRNRVESLTEVA
jgi:diguanylate cyclase